MLRLCIVGTLVLSVFVSSLSLSFNWGKILSSEMCASEPLSQHQFNYLVVMKCPIPIFIAIPKMSHTWRRTDRNLCNELCVPD